MLSGRSWEVNDLVVEGKIFLWSRGIVEGCVGIKNGRIAEIKKVARGEEKIRCRGVILPGGVDIHVHMREPGMTHKEDFYTGTVAAACGGTTAVVDMPNTFPPTDDLDSLREKKRLAEKSAVDYGIMVALTEKLGSQVRAAEEATGIKWYYGTTTGAVGWGDAKKGVSVLAYIAGQSDRCQGKLLTVHAEKGDGTGDNARSLEEHSRMRSVEREVEAVEAIGNTVKKAGEETKRDVNEWFVFNIAHVSSPMTVETARKHGFRTEVTPHHLFLDTGMALGPLGKVNPPLRSKAERMGLWKKLVSGEVDVVASDHAPHTFEEKNIDFPEAPAGLPGVETRMPLIFYEVKRGNLDLEMFVGLVSRNPAKMLGVPKGEIAIGLDADLAVFSFQNVSRVMGEKLHSKCGWTPFEGFNAIFPDTVICRGGVVVRDGEFVGERGWGKYLGGNKADGVGEREH